MTLGELRTQIAASLKTITEEWETESQQLLCGLLDISRLDLVLERGMQLSDDDVDKVVKALNRRLEREPLQYILGTQGFMGLDFIVTPGVLIPRHDTETLVAYAIDLLATLETPYVLDIGTGSGAIILSILKALKGAQGVAIDISVEALNVARQNAEQLNISSRVVFRESDIFSGMTLQEKQVFDLIISNPPYIPLDDKETLQREITEYEPESALYGGTDGLSFYRKIIPEAKAYLKSGGWLMFEAGHDQAPAVETLLRQCDYEKVSHFNDLRGVSRFIIGRKQ